MASWDLFGLLCKTWTVSTTSDRLVQVVVLAVVNALRFVDHCASVHSQRLTETFLNTRISKTDCNISFLLVYQTKQTCGKILPHGWWTRTEHFVVVIPCNHFRMNASAQTCALWNTCPSRAMGTSKSVYKIRIIVVTMYSAPLHVVCCTKNPSTAIMP